MLKKILLAVMGVTVVGLVLFFAIDGSAKKQDVLKTVAVERGSIVDKALAVGQIEPKKENTIKSKIPGIVGKIFVDIGDHVKVGDPLFEIAPDPTPMEFAEAKRQVEIYQVACDNAKREYDRHQTLRDKQLVSFQEYETKKAAFEEADLRLKLANEKLALIEPGRSEIAELNIDNIIRSPISGTVLSRLVEEGDPVVPLTSYQAGTELMTLAEMDDLIFRGNVDEIDVGKVSTGILAEIEVGAIPNEKLIGKVRNISPKAHRDQGSTLFEVEIVIDDLGDNYLRAGYSANADLIISRSEDILLVPERLVTIDDSIATVEVQDTLGAVTTRDITIGLSDGINIEVVEGLDEGELIVERPPREITAD
ncbi:MAG: efflux RND transporter periplasmic adaptor subunit [candidate division Zixibacteria bacterium]|nr:efflux RND transporter periplasmic adaptor subunit [candidate division Zixibacteria bacterium]MDH3936148.1 efflux RND transporter periplasmic adaptor subunit [candidate division Zixibacteria bacterium]MDH4034454.1 efflux RND transporter periplasmic adaptor subunit [candidate division Zixibacteria bacterium]